LNTLKTIAGPDVRFQFLQFTQSNNNADLSVYYWRGTSLFLFSVLCTPKKNSLLNTALFQQNLKDKSNVNALDLIASGGHQTRSKDTARLREEANYMTRT